MEKQSRKVEQAVARHGWIPYWYGNKQSKRLAQKRLRREAKKNIELDKAEEAVLEGENQDKEKTP